MKYMPKFLYTIVACALLSWGFLIRYASITRPDSPKEIIVFLLLLLLALCLTLSLGLYFYYYKKAPDFSNLKGLYRKGFRWAFFYSVGIVGFLFLKGFGFLNIITGVLYLVFYLLLLSKVRKRR